MSEPIEMKIKDLKKVIYDGKRILVGALGAYKIGQLLVDGELDKQAQNHCLIHGMSNGMVGLHIDDTVKSHLIKEIFAPVWSALYWAFVLSALRDAGVEVRFRPNYTPEKDSKMVNIVVSD